MKKIIIVLSSLIILVAAGGAGYFYFFKLKHPHKSTEIIVPKSLFFAKISDLVVSVQSGAGSSSASGGDQSSSNQVFVEISVQFSTNNPKAIDSFNALQPIIQAEIVDFLMKKTAAKIMDPSTYNKLCSNFLAIANEVLDKNQNFYPKDPFLGAYITNIVQQD